MLINLSVPLVLERGFCGKDTAVLAHTITFVDLDFVDLVGRFFSVKIDGTTIYMWCV